MSDAATIVSEALGILLGCTCLFVWNNPSALKCLAKHAQARAAGLLAHHKAYKTVTARKREHTAGKLSGD